MAYRLTVSGRCGDLLRYGGAQVWGPHERTLNPGQSAPLKGTITLPASSDSTKLPCFEQVELQTDAEPLNPQIMAQEASIYHDIDLTP